MSNISDIISKAISPDPITIETIKAAIDKLEIEHLFFGVYKVQECATMKGTETIAISGDTAYYWPDIFELKEFKVLKLTELPKPELSFSWDFETTENIHL